MRAHYHKTSSGWVGHDEGGGPPVCEAVYLSDLLTRLQQLGYGRDDIYHQGARNRYRAARLKHPTPGLPYVVREQELNEAGEVVASRVLCYCFGQRTARRIAQALNQG
jgi:hypothetical protein